MKVKIAISEPSEVIDPFITDLSSYIAKSKRALIVTGAGISCSSGIPVKYKLISNNLSNRANCIVKGFSLCWWFI